MKLSAKISPCLIALFLFAIPARAGGIALSPEAAKALDQIYNGDNEAAVATARGIEQAQPDSPVGYLLEAEAQWWNMYCAACEIKWGMLDAFKRGKQPEDAAYLALADNAIQLARAQIAKSDTADMHVYVAIGFALKARLYSLRDQKRDGLGLYNYYVDTLSGIAKMLRFFMGIPGGNKDEGIRQMKVGMEHGAFLAADSRFYLAKNLRTYDRHYDKAVQIAEPLATRYPRNPTFLLLLGNLNQELGRNAKAAEYFHAAQTVSIADPVCAARARDLANSFLAVPR